jgi:hypothetical protein
VRLRREPGFDLAELVPGEGLADPVGDGVLVEHLGTGIGRDRPGLGRGRAGGREDGEEERSESAGHVERNTHLEWAVQGPGGVPYADMAWRTSPPVVESRGAMQSSVGRGA